MVDDDDDYDEDAQPVHGHHPHCPLSSAPSCQTFSPVSDRSQTYLKSIWWILVHTPLTSARRLLKDSALAMLVTAVSPARLFLSFLSGILYMFWLAGSPFSPWEQIKEYIRLVTKLWWTGSVRMIREVISTSNLWLARFALLSLLTRLSIWVGET